MDVKSKTTEELAEMLAAFVKREIKLDDFFEVKYEYDDRFPRISFSIVGPTGNPTLEEFFPDGIVNDHVPSHVFKISDGRITHVDINEFMWAFGSDYFGKSGYVAVENFENLGEHND